MCVIAYVPAGKSLTLEQCRAMYETNPDGAGFAWEDRNNQWRIKTFMDLNAFWNAYSGTIQGYTDKDFLVHFRIGTHGGKTIDNVHPFRVNHNTVMAHNGIVSCVPDYHDGRSDTRVFVEETLPKLPELWLDTPELRWLVEDGIGNSKMVFLTNDPRLSATTYFLNKSSGKELESGIWVSNTLWTRNLPSNKKAIVTVAAFGKKEPFKTGNGSWKYSTEGGITSGEWFPIGAATERWTANNDALFDPINEPDEPFTSSGDIWTDQNKLEDARRLLGFKQPVALYNGEWTCMGCWYDLDATGSCQCFSSICLQCYDYGAYCTDGFDTKDIVLVDHIIRNPKQYEEHLPYISHLHEDLGWMLADSFDMWGSE